MRSLWLVIERRQEPVVNAGVTELSMLRATDSFTVPKLVHKIMANISDRFEAAICEPEVEPAAFLCKLLTVFVKASVARFPM